MKSAKERIESAGTAGKTMGDGVAGGAGQGMGALNGMNSALDSAGSAATAAGAAGESAGLKIKSSFDNAADASNSMGSSFAQNFDKAQKSGKGFGDSVKTGISGALDTARKKADTFTKGVVDGAKKAGNAFLHPIQTIKGKFADAMKGAVKDTDKVGDAAKDSEKDLKDMGDKGSSAGEKMKSGLGGVLKVLGAIAIAAVAVTGLAKFTTEALNASQAANNISYSFEKTFGESSPDVENWANNFSDAVHRNTTEVKSFLTSNKQLYEGMGLTGEAADDLSKATTSLAYDLGNFSGMDDAEALSKLQDAISGNDAALADFGVRLDQATLKQTAMAMGLGDDIDALDEATMAQVRMNAILEQTSEIQGAASSSIGGFAGGVKALQGAWTGFLEKAGNKLAPLFDKIFGIILDLWPQIEPQLMGFVELLADGFADAIPVLADLAEQLFPALFEILGSLMPIIGTLAETLFPVLSQVILTVANAIQPLMPLIQTVAEKLLPPVANLIGRLIETLLPPLTTLLGAITPILDALSPAIEFVANWIGFLADMVSGLIGWLTTGIEKLGEFAQAVKNSAVGQAFASAGEWVGGVASDIGSAFTGNAGGTDDFAGGWTHVNEAGGEILHAKRSGGLAFLPKGSAVIPANQTEQLLSGDSGSARSGGVVIDITGLLPDRSADSAVGWVPTVVEGLQTIAEESKDDDKPTDDKPKSPPPPTGDGGDPGDFDSPDSPVIRKEITLKIVVEGGNLSPAAEQALIDAAKDAAREVFREEQQAEIDILSIQNGYTA